MIVVRIFKNNAWYLAGIATAVNFENCIKQLGYYFANIIKVKEMINAGEIIDLPYLTFQRDRRVNQEKRIRDERRRHLMYLSRKRKSQAKGGGHIN
ncbi:hypothetical protein ES705_37733 [subsurface metagenome]